MGTIEKFLNRKKMLNYKDKITDKQKEQLLLTLEAFTGSKINNRIDNIVGFLKYGVEDNWVDRLNKIVNELGVDTSSKKAVQIRYGDNYIDQIILERKNKCKHTKEKFIERYGDDLGVLKWLEYIQSKKAYGLKYQIERYGEIEGTCKWNDMLNRKITTMQERKKIKKYRNGQTLKEFIERYGLEIGVCKYENKIKRLKYINTIDYYKENYGDDIGYILWNESNKMRIKHLKSFLDLRDGSEEEKEVYYNKLKSGGSKYSKISQRLFWIIYSKLTEEQRKNCKFGDLNGEEMFITLKEWKNFIFVDFKIKNKIIEFDGDYWHSLDNKKNTDLLRDEWLLDKGYKVLRIKEIEFINNSEDTVEKCLKFINNE